jgi:hypothetical protein
MTPRDHHDQREAPLSPQALVRDLRAQEGALPEALRRQCLAAGATVAPALIALLEAALADDQPEPEGALFHAVDFLGALGEARAVPILLRCLAHDDLADGLALQAAVVLRTLRPSALDGCLAAYVMTTNAAFRDRLAGVMSRCGVHDARIYACLVETLLRRRPGARPCGRRQSWAHVLPSLRGPANPDGIPPVGMAGARSIRRVISRSNRASGSARMTSAPRLAPITPWRLCRRGLVTVGPPTAGDAQHRGGDHHGPRLSTDG